MSKFEIVQAYRCIYCGKLFAKAQYHRVCKNDPTVIHCGACQRYRYIYDQVGEDGEFFERRHSCQKHHLSGWPGIPRKRECKDYLANTDASLLELRIAKVDTTNMWSENIPEVHLDDR